MSDNVASKYVAKLVHGLINEERRVTGDGAGAEWLGGRNGEWLNTDRIVAADPNTFVSSDDDDVDLFKPRSVLNREKDEIGPDPHRKRYKSRRSDPQNDDVDSTVGGEEEEEEEAEEIEEEVAQEVSEEEKEKQDTNDDAYWWQDSIADLISDELPPNSNDGNNDGVEQKRMPSPSSPYKRRQVEMDGRGDADDEQKSSKRYKAAGGRLESDWTKKTGQPPSGKTSHSKPVGQSPLSRVRLSSLASRSKDSTSSEDDELEGTIAYRNGFTRLVPEVSPSKGSRASSMSRFQAPRRISEYGDSSYEGNRGRVSMNATPSWRGRGSIGSQDFPESHKTINEGKRRHRGSDDASPFGTRSQNQATSTQDKPAGPTPDYIPGIPQAKLQTEEDMDWELQEPDKRVQSWIEQSALSRIPEELPQTPEEGVKPNHSPAMSNYSSSPRTIRSYSGKGRQCHSGPRRTTPRRHVVCRVARMSATSDVDRDWKEENQKPLVSPREVRALNASTLTGYQGKETGELIQRSIALEQDSSRRLTRQTSAKVPKIASLTSDTRAVVSGDDPHGMSTQLEGLALEDFVMADGGDDYIEYGPGDTDRMELEQQQQQQQQQQQPQQRRRRRQTEEEEKEEEEDEKKNQNEKDRVPKPLEKVAQHTTEPEHVPSSRGPKASEVKNKDVTRTKSPQTPRDVGKLPSSSRVRERSLNLQSTSISRQSRSKDVETETPSPRHTPSSSRRSARIAKASSAHNKFDDSLTDESGSDDGDPTGTYHAPASKASRTKRSFKNKNGRDAATTGGRNTATKTQTLKVAPERPNYSKPATTVIDSIESEHEMDYIRDNIESEGETDYIIDNQGDVQTDNGQSASISVGTGNFFEPGRPRAKEIPRRTTETKEEQIAKLRRRGMEIATELQQMCERESPASEDLRADQMKTVKLLFEEFHTHGGCSPAKHRALRQEHNEKIRNSGGSHNDLSKWIEEEIPDPMDIVGDLAKDSNNQNRIKTYQKAATRYIMDTPNLAKKLYEGYDEDSTSPRNLCLHEEHVSDETEPRETDPLKMNFDVDSYLFFPRSLAFAKRGMLFSLSYDPSANISKNVVMGENALEMYQVDQENVVETHRPSKASNRPNLNISQTPHAYLGTAMADQLTPVFIVLPNLMDEEDGKDGNGRKRTMLTLQEHNRLINKVLLPAIRAVAPSIQAESFPGSAQAAADKATAKYKEQGVMANKNAPREPKRQRQHYPLKGEKLDELWKKMVEIVKHKQWTEFNGMSLFVDVKNTKKTISAEDLEGAICQFLAHSEPFIDFAYINPDRMWIDLASQVQPESSDPGESEARKTILHQKMCCGVDQVVRLMERDPALARDGRPHTTEKIGGGAQFFHTALLRDIGNWRLVNQKKSVLYKGGCSFLQHYGTWKTVFDAQGVYPYTHELLLEAGISPKVRKDVRQMSKTTNIDEGKVEGLYKESTARALRGCDANRDASYGARFEGRLSLRLIFAMLDECSFIPKSQRPCVDPNAYIRVESSRWFRFIRHQITKYALGFEAIMLRTDNKPEWEDSKVAICMLSHLEHACGSSFLPMYRSIWSGIRRAKDEADQTMTGMHAKTSMDRYGIAWLPGELFNWSWMRFSMKWRDKVLFGNRKLYHKYGSHARGRRRADFGEVLNELDGCTTIDQRDFLKTYLAFRICASLRAETWELMKKSIMRADQAKWAEFGEVPLTVYDISRLTETEASIAENQTTFKNYRQWFDIAFGEDGEKVGDKVVWRGTWTDIAFRKFYRSAMSKFEEQEKDGAGAVGLTITPEAWKREVMSIIWNHNTLLPSLQFVTTEAKTKWPTWWRRQKGVLGECPERVTFLPIDPYQLASASRDAWEVNFKTHLDAHKGSSALRARMDNKEWYLDIRGVRDKLEELGRERLPRLLGPVEKLELPRKPSRTGGIKGQSKTKIG